MPVDTKHPEYERHYSKWERIRDVTAGGDEVKARGEAYLPKPNGLDHGEYRSYVLRAEFYPATQRTVDGLHGAVFRKDPVISRPEGADDVIERATPSGEDFTTLAKSVVENVLTMGRYGVLVDFDDERQMPVAVGYPAESIINWRQSLDENRRPFVSLIVLREYREVPDGDGFGTKAVECYRVLSTGRLEGARKRGVMSTLFERAEGGKSDAVNSGFIQIGETKLLTRKGKHLTEIPFFWFSPTTTKPCSVAKSPILDLTDTNLSHYRTSAELEEGAYFTGTPMYWISGKLQGATAEDRGTFQVGSRNAILMDENGQAGVLTVSGEDMGLLKELMHDKERRMAVLGARILEDQKKAVEAAAAVELRHRGENSLLSTISDTASRGLTNVLKLMLWWAGNNDPEAEVKLNRDFIGAPMTPREMVELAAVLQSGGIGEEVYFNALKQGERVPDNWTVEDWRQDVKDRTPGFEDDLNNDSHDGHEENAGDD